MKIKQIKPEDRKKRSAMKENDPARAWNLNWTTPWCEEEEEIVIIWNSEDIRIAQQPSLTSYSSFTSWSPTLSSSGGGDAKTDSSFATSDEQQEVKMMQAAKAKSVEVVNDWWNRNEKAMNQEKNNVVVGIIDSDQPQISQKIKIQPLQPSSSKFNKELKSSKIIDKGSKEIPVLELIVDENNIDIVNNNVYNVLFSRLQDKTLEKKKQKLIVIEEFDSLINKNGNKEIQNTTKTDTIINIPTTKQQKISRFQEELESIDWGKWREMEKKNELLIQLNTPPLPLSSSSNNKDYFNKDVGSEISNKNLESESIKLINDQKEKPLLLINLINLDEDDIIYSTKLSSPLITSINNSSNNYIKNDLKEIMSQEKQVKRDNQENYETQDKPIARHEHYLASYLNVKPGMQVLDIGCGVGGPAREIAHFTGAHITGLNNNDYQISRAIKSSVKCGLGNDTSFVKGNFLEIPFKENTYDAIYAIEATCHSPKLSSVYAEAFRVLKPGGKFAFYEWCLTDKYDSTNSEHRRIVRGIEYADGIPELFSTKVAEQALKDVGFEVEVTSDLADNNDCVPWYYPLEGNLSNAQTFWDYFTVFRMTGFGKFCTRSLVWSLETFGIIPPGSLQTQYVLETAGDCLVEGGRLGLFTPMFLMSITTEFVFADLVH
ncbi:2565_t:CDS:10 [Diversispora eburnea]|uniref:Sterol 24-C-methyltransferase n=1 Tax=Diversispora eburnea TaxID=1213867 RepID=A0A9N8YIH2_9GLOM|nr:2565_t:CDS:10 [Diversispora eburnea]